MKRLLIVLLGTGLTHLAMAQSEYQSGIISIGIVVSDLDRSMEFYQEVLGMVKVNRYDITLEMGQKTGLSGGIPFFAEVLKVEDKPEATEWKLISFNKEAAHPKQKWIQDDTGMQYATFMVTSLKPFLERIEKHNIPLLGETPIAITESMDFVLIQDPDGNFVELIGPSE